MDRRFVPATTNRWTGGKEGNIFAVSLFVDAGGFETAGPTLKMMGTEAARGRVGILLVEGSDWARAPTTVALKARSNPGKVAVTLH
jgi:hypothetical protein